jgi:hypothetical protein
MRGLRVLLVLGLLAGLVSVTGAAAAQGGQLLFDGVGNYPRVIRLQHSGPVNGRVIASVNSSIAEHGVGVIFESRDGGVTFRRLAVIREPEGRRGQCCGTLFELPRPLGALPAGTLLWANTTGWEGEGRDHLVRQRLWRSLDHGRTWGFLADIAVSPTGFNAWEPELSMAADGQLVAHWADESDKPDHDQKIVQARSVDGVRWSAPTDTVVSSDFFVRPGMPGVRQLPDGSYFMVYEVCNLDEPLCSIYWRSSPDGWDYGDPEHLGTGVRTAEGKYPRHTPTIDVAPDGTILLASEMVVNADDSPAANNGAAILVNRRGGAGAWGEMPAPIQIHGVNNEGCRNFSPALLASNDSVLEIATDYDRGVCKAYYATGPVA